MPFPALPSFLESLRRRVPGLTGRGGGVPPIDPMNVPLVQLGPDDFLSPYECAEGILCMGATGSGKTSGSGATILRSYMAAGWGGLILCAKPGEYDAVRKVAQEANRLPDVIRFSPEEQWRFNPTAFEYSRPTRGAGLATNVASVLLQGMEAGGRGGNVGGDDSFWRDAREELVTSAVHLAALAKQTVRISDLLRIIQTAPASRDDVQAPDSAWRRNSECFAMLLEASKNATTDASRGDYDITEQYFLATYPEISDRTRGVIVSSFTALISPMLRSPMRELFCGDTNIDPTACERGAIIVVDLPLKLFGSVGAFAQVLWKASFQRAMEQRDIAKSPLPVFLWADECQFFVSSGDTSFCATARSARVCTVYLTQNLPSLYQALGQDRTGRDKADSLAGNLTLKIWHTNAEPVTNQKAAEAIGMTWQLKRSSNQGTSSNMTQSGGSLNADTTTSVNSTDSSGASVQEQLAFQVQPQEFTTLRTGGVRNNLLVDGIVFKPGRIWNATGTNYMRVTFKQR